MFFMLPPLPELNSGYQIERLKQAGSATAQRLVAAFVAGISCCCGPQGVDQFRVERNRGDARFVGDEIVDDVPFGSAALVALATAVVATSANTTAATRMRI
jgi:hypothetical protein